MSIIFLLPDFSHAIEKFQITFQFSPSLETLNPRENLQKQYKLSYNFGAEYKHYLSPGFSFSAGILYQNKGFRYVLGDVDSGNTNILFNKRLLLFTAEYISVPLNMNIHIPVTDRTRLIFSAGITNGYLLRQFKEARRLKDGDEGQYKLPGEFETDGKIDLKIISTRFTGINLAISASKYFRQKMIFEIGMSYSRQLNSATLKERYILTNEQTPGFDSIALDFRIGYFFNKQIKNQQKDF